MDRGAARKSATVAIPGTLATTLTKNHETNNMEKLYYDHEGIIQLVAVIATIIVAYFAVFKPIFDYIRTQKKQRKDKRFETYHKLIDIFVGAAGPTRLDRQIAIAFEFRNFPEYHIVTKRILIGLKERWNVPENERLITEMDLTIEYIDSSYFKRLICCKN